jgi:hypothetical protein
MALLFMEGFDHYGTGGDPSSFGKWVSGTGPSVQSSPTRTGTHSLRMTAVSSDLVSKSFTTSGGFIVGLALHFTTTPTTTDFIQVREGTTVHLALGITTGSLLTVKRGSTLLATGTTVLSQNNWYYIEFKGTIHDTTGSYDVRVDGVSQAGLSSGSGDTQNAGTGIWNNIRLSSASSISATYIDDFYLCDTSGSAPRNTFLGAVKVETLLPQTGNGSNTGLTPSTGTDHGALVDEIPPNTTDYNGSATVGVKDTYNYPSMTLTGTIYGIQTNLYCQKSDASARSVCAVVRHSGVDTDGANVSPLTTYSYLSEVRPQKPDSSEWLVADVNAVEVGMKVTV